MAVENGVSRERYNRMQWAYLRVILNYELQYCLVFLSLSSRSTR
jgi:hypothetical protein